MKKCCLCLFLVLLLTGCGSVETFETVNDVWDRPAMAPVGELVLTLPESAASQAVQSGDGGKLYFCDDYVLTVQTLDGGDMDQTTKTLCGYESSALNILETSLGVNKRREWVWMSAGEGGDTIGRAAVIDDGHYHYCVTVMAGAQEAGELEAEWNALFSSLRLG